MVLKTSTRQTVFLPVAGLVPPESLKPGDLVGVNKDSYLILDTLPAEYDSRWVLGGWMLGAGRVHGCRRGGEGSNGGCVHLLDGMCVECLCSRHRPTTPHSTAARCTAHAPPLLAPPTRACPHRVKAMEVDEKPTEDYSDIGGLDKQIQELREAIVLPITHKVCADVGVVRWWGCWCDGADAG